MVDTRNEFDNQESPGPKWNPRKSKLLAAGLALLILALVFAGIYAVSSIWFDLVIVGLASLSGTTAHADSRNPGDRNSHQHISIQLRPISEVRPGLTQSRRSRIVRLNWFDRHRPVAQTVADPVPSLVHIELLMPC